MTIQLSSDRERMILSLLQAGRFSSADAVIDEALRLVEERYAGPEEPTTPGQAEENIDRTAERLETLNRLGRKPEAMPAAGADDGFSNRRGRRCQA